MTAYKHMNIIHIQSKQLPQANLLAKNLSFRLVEATGNQMATSADKGNVYRSKGKTVAVSWSPCFRALPSTKFLIFKLYYT